VIGPLGLTIDHRRGGRWTPRPATLADVLAAARAFLDPVFGGIAETFAVNQWAPTAVVGIWVLF